MKDKEVLYNLENYLEGKKAYHTTNFLLLVDNPRPIPEHTDFMSALEEELSKVAHYEDLLHALGNIV